MTSVKFVPYDHESHFSDVSDICQNVYSGSDFLPRFLEAREYEARFRAVFVVSTPQRRIGFIPSFSAAISLADDIRRENYSRTSRCSASERSSDGVEGCCGSSGFGCVRR